MTQKELDSYAIPFLRELARNETIMFNGKRTYLAIYNLILAKRDLGLWAAGMKPHRHWRVTDVKKHYGLKGNDREKLVEQIKDLYKAVMEVQAEVLQKD